MSVRILVLLSTYNGEKYVLEQLNSILSQNFDGDLNLLIRDDGSTDKTLEIIYGIQDSRIEVIVGNNLGAKLSYMTLLGVAREREYDFYALADQDDVWLPLKINRAVSCLRDNGMNLYCSSLNLVNDLLKPIDKYIYKDDVNFKSSLFYNCVTGCSCVFDRQILVYLDSDLNVNNIMMHDWWLYQITTIFGSVYYDKESYILYRQHDANVVGMNVGLTSLLNKVHTVLHRSKIPNRFTQAKELLKVYGESMSKPDRLYLMKFVDSENSFLKRVSFSLSCRPRRIAMLNDFISMVSFILGR